MVAPAPPHSSLVLHTRPLLSPVLLLLLLLLPPSAVSQSDSRPDTDYGDEMMTTAATRASGTNSAVGFNEPEQIVPQNQLDAQNPFSMSTMYGHTRPFTHAHGVSPYASASAMPWHFCFIAPMNIMLCSTCFSISLRSALSTFCVTLKSCDHSRKVVSVDRRPARTEPRRGGLIGALSSEGTLPPAPMLSKGTLVPLVHTQRGTNPCSQRRLEIDVFVSLEFEFLRMLQFEVACVFISFIYYKLSAVRG